MNILNFEKDQKSYFTISVLGNNYRLNVKYSASNYVELKKKESEFELYLPKKYKNIDKVSIINQSIQKLYDEIAEKELDYSMELVRHIVKFAPEDYKIQRLNGNFCKVKSKVLFVNPDIIQYNREIINVTLIQEFCKMKHKPGTKVYKKDLSDAMKCYEEYKWNDRATSVRKVL